MSLVLRWTVALATATLVIVGGTALSLELSLRQLEKNERGRWRELKQEELVARLEIRGVGTTSGVSDAAGDPGLRSLLAETIRGEPAARRPLIDWAEEHHARLGLDLLLVLSLDGTILSHSSWPASFGIPHPRRDLFLSARTGELFVWRSGRDSDARWMLGSSAELELGGRRYVVVGGRSMEGEALLTLRDLLDVPRLETGLALSGLEEAPLPTSWRIDGDYPLMIEYGAPPAGATVRQLRRRVGGLSLAALLVILISAPLMAQGLARPLRRLAGAVKEMEGGAKVVSFPATGPGEVRALAGALDDLSKGLAEEQARARAAERRAAWRDMARRMAHELKNAMSPLTLALDNVETAVGRDDEAARRALGASLAAARDQLHSLDRLVTEFRSFARMPRLHFDSVDADALARQALAGVSQARPDGRFELAEGPPVGEVGADGEQLRRALHNLLINAHEAAPDRPVELALGPGPGDDRWWLTVRDRGPGLDPAVASRLGEPYLTTKPSGTGLGLAITLQVVEGHGGRLEDRPRDGGGLEMNISLPRRPAPVVDEDEEEPLT